MRMRFSLFPIFLTVAGLLLAAPVASVQAGSAVATDNHGGFGYSYGDRPQEQLEQEAIHHCREKSDFPDDVHVVVTSRHGGAGIIVHYSIDGRPHIYAYVGAKDDRQAYH